MQCSNFVRCIFNSFLHDTYFYNCSTQDAHTHTHAWCAIVLHTKSICECSYVVEYAPTSIPSAKVPFAWHVVPHCKWNRIYVCDCGTHYPTIVLLFQRISFLFFVFRLPFAPSRRGLWFIQLYTYSAHIIKVICICIDMIYDSATAAAQSTDTRTGTLPIKCCCFSFPRSFWNWNTSA